MSDTKFICPFCKSRLKSDMYQKTLKIEIFCDNCGKFISNCDISSKVLKECEATLEVRLRGDSDAD